VATEHDPWEFLGKSHCVPIILALDKDGMMNRNQLYQKLGGTINIIIKRIELLKELGIIEEYRMNVKPFAKYIDLTVKGITIAHGLQQIITSSHEKKSKYERKVHIRYWHALDTLDGRQTGDVMIKRFEENEYCPICSKPTHLLKDKDEYVWECFNCGLRKEIDENEAMEMALIEYDIIQYMDSEESKE